MSKEQSKITQTYKTKRDLCFAISAILNYVPLLVIVIYSMFSGKIEASQKFVVSGSVTIAGILLVLNALFKLKLRSPIFIILLGITIALHKMYIVVVSILAYICIVQILDEFLLEPGYKKYHKLLTINREIDKRG